MMLCNEPKNILFDIKEISTNPDITTTTTTSNSILSYEEDKIVISTLVEVKVKQQIYPTQEDLDQHYTKYEASNEYADVVFYTNSTSQQFLFIEVNIKNSEGVSAVHKLTNMVTVDDSTKTYKGRKKTGIVHAAALVPEQWKDYMLKHPKKDDLADAFLQGLWFMENSK